MSAIRSHNGNEASGAHNSLEVTLYASPILLNDTVCVVVSTAGANDATGDHNVTGANGGK